MRIALLAAFPFPYPQGSQIYFAEQAAALREAGAEVVLFTYGRGEGELPASLRTCEWVRAPEALSPGVFRSGPQARKPVADVALLARYAAAARRERFDLALAHNAEAAFVALAARPSTRIPVLYCIHTLLAEELSAYLPAERAALANALGARIDRALARRADGLLALCEAARDALAPFARGEIALAPPGLAPAADPPPDLQAAACRAHDLEPGGFALYSGNLDAYQDLDLLAAASRRSELDDLPLVIATHDARATSRDGGGLRDRGRLRVVEVADFAQMRALCFAARALVLARRRTGGFPVKLLNYMEARRPIVAFEAVAAGLEHEKNAWLLPAGAGAAELARALARLTRDDALAERLGAAGRVHLETAHAWPALAATTLALAGRLARQR